MISDGSSLGQSLLLLLDAIQPAGIMPILLDQNNLLPLLGAAASRNHYLPVQVIESGAFIGLGTVVSVIASANYGDQVLRAKLTYNDGTEAAARKSNLVDWKSCLWRMGNLPASACSRFVGRCRPGRRKKWRCHSDGRRAGSCHRCPWTSLTNPQ